MTDATDARRMKNLLGAFALAASDRIHAATSAGRPATDTAALLLLTTTMDGVTQETLAQPLGLSQSGVTRLVDRLVAEGLVRREAGANRRSVAIMTTAAGRAAASAGLAARERACDDLLHPLTASERRTVTRLLEKLLRPTPTSLPSAHRICRLCDPGACGHEQGRCPVTQGLENRERTRDNHRR